MSKIYVVMGKSATGKDTIFQRLQMCETLQLHKVISYTTRPIRSKEKDGVAYHFVDDKKLMEYREKKLVIEERAYHTIHGIWHYFLVNDGQIRLESGENYIIIGTLESFLQIREYYGEHAVIPIYIEIPDDIRLERALAREKKQEHPKYAELCRRFLADEEDFSETKLINAGIKKRYANENLDLCVEQIVQDMN